MATRQDRSMMNSLPTLATMLLAIVPFALLLGMFAAMMAQPLLIRNWIAGFLVIPAFAAMWFIRVPNEKAMMRARFGGAWDACCARAGRLFPRCAS